MIYFNHNRSHRKIGEKDLVHIEKVSDDTFVQYKIIPNIGIMPPILGMFHMCSWSYILNSKLFWTMWKKHINNNYRILKYAGVYKYLV